MRDIELMLLIDEVRLIERRLSLVLAETGLTVSQLRLLHQIYKRGPISPSRLSTELKITKPSVTAQLRELEKTGSISTRPHPDDKRSSLISLSESGRTRLTVALENIHVLEGVVGKKMILQLSNAVHELNNSFSAFSRKE